MLVVEDVRLESLAAESFAWRQAHRMCCKGGASILLLPLEIREACWQELEQLFPMEICCMLTQDWPISEANWVSHLREQIGGVVPLGLHFAFFFQYLGWNKRRGQRGCGQGKRLASSLRHQEVSDWPWALNHITVCSKGAHDLSGGFRFT